MRTWKRLTASVIGIAVIGAAAAAFAQGGARKGGGNYNPATEATLSGTIDEVQSVPSGGKGPGGLHLVLSTDAGKISVHVGPASYVSSKNVSFAKGDTLTVIGSKVTMDGQAVVIARQIKKGDQVLTLRDAQGFPLWSGRGRGQ